MSGLRDKVAIITGSSSGIGATTAVEFAKVGAKVVLTARRHDKLEETAQRCVDAGLNRGKIHLVVADIMKDEHLKKIIDSTADKFGQIDVLVNNAGVAIVKLLQETTADDVETMYRVHVRAPFVLMKLALPHLIKAKGSIVNVSSIASQTSFPYVCPYGMAKRALDHMTKGASIELGSKGVRVNSVCPGVILTEIFKVMDYASDLKKVLDDEAECHPLKRNGQPEEVAKVILFLASDDASFVSGVNMPIDGARHNTSWMPASKMELFN